MYRNLLICLFASIALVCAQSTTPQPIGKEVTNRTNPSIINSSTTLAPISTTSSSASTTTTTTTTTKPPTTTTAKPNTTTVAPPNPPPVPIPDTFKGNVTEGNKTCINVEFSVKITIKYNNTINEEKTTGFSIPTNASVDLKSSRCSDDPKKPTPETITIGFDKEEHTSANLTLTFNTTEDGSIIVEEVQLSFVATKDLMPGLDSKLYGQTIIAAKNELSLFKVASVHSYVCSTPQPAKLDSHEARITGVLIEFTDSRVEAYINESNKGKFDSAIDCKSADISDVVPIAVGAALAGLVVIVLIAYFIGRRRSRRLAYQSV